MGFMDKLKEAAQDVATEAKKATAQGKEKVGEFQIRKKMDEAAKKLGYLTHREKTENVPSGAEAAALIAEISALARANSSKQFFSVHAATRAHVGRLP